MMKHFQLLHLKNLLAAGAVLGLLSCGKSSDDLTLKKPSGKDGSDIKITTSDRVTTVTGTDVVARLQSGADAKLPTGIELYPGGEIDTAMTGNASGSYATGLSFKTPDSVAQIAGFYKDHFAKKGYALTSETPGSDSLILTFQRKSGSGTAMLMINRNKTMSSAVITLSAT